MNREQLAKAAGSLRSQSRLAVGTYYSQATDCFCAIGVLALSLGHDMRELHYLGLSDLDKVQDAYGLRETDLNDIYEANDNTPEAERIEGVIRFLTELTERDERECSQS